ENNCYPENGSCIWGCDPEKCVNGRCGTCIDGCVTGWVGQSCICGKCNVCVHGVTEVMTMQWKLQEKEEIG
ncbi:Hypothetical predicted protein, partial [Mytilus galloprovincialis]